MGWDCCDAQAPSCEPRGRFDQYSAVSCGVTFVTGPRTCTCRPSPYHGKVTAAWGVSAISAPLAES